MVVLEPVKTGVSREDGLRDWQLSDTGDSYGQIALSVLLIHSSNNGHVKAVLFLSDLDELLTVGCGFPAVIVSSVLGCEAPPVFLDEGEGRAVVSKE